jgi:hypothetical protein
LQCEIGLQFANGSVVYKCACATLRLDPFRDKLNQEDAIQKAHINGA